MRFGPFPPRAAEGGIVAHALRLPDGSWLRKGQRIGPEQVELLERAGVAAVTVALLDPSDVSEDTAALAVADALAGPGTEVRRPGTGRCNVVATESGLLTLDAEGIRAVNEVDEAVTVSTLRPDVPVRPGTLVATVKVIPFGTARSVVDSCVSAAERSAPLVRVDPFRHVQAALVTTAAEGTPDSPTEPARRGPAGVVLAAGRSARMGSTNKLLVEVAGMPMVRRVVRTALDARLDPVVVVLGHEAGEVRDVLHDLPVTFVDNPDHRAGMGTSVARGVGALSDTVEGALILLGDMPWITTGDVTALVEAFAPEEGRGICVPTIERKWGNPILWAARYFPELRALEGDVGARHLLAVYDDDVCEVPVSGAGVLRDVDTRQALERAPGTDG
jgi:CTP:molybdopterin cytidylyltransferase MocA